MTETRGRDRQPIDLRPVAAPRAKAVPASQRKRFVAEILIVLSVFPLPYTIDPATTATMA